MALFTSFQEFEGAYEIPGEREWIGVFTGRGDI
jgi:hypothetical protein